MNTYYCLLLIASICSKWEFDGSLFEDYFNNAYDFVLTDSITTKLEIPFLKFNQYSCYKSDPIKQEISTAVDLIGNNPNCFNYTVSEVWSVQVCASKASQYLKATEEDEEMIVEYVLVFFIFNNLRAWQNRMRTISRFFITNKG
jgi:hypothetical protein